MRALLLAVSLTGLVRAQGPVTFPAGLLRVPGPSGVERIQPWAAESTRFQYVDPSLVGASREIHALSMRRDDTAAPPSQARTSQVTVVLAHARAALGPKFDANYADTPVVVFSRTVELPSTSGVDHSWGRILLPFERPFAYDGKRPLLIELRCTETRPAGPYSLDCVDGGTRGRGQVDYPELAADRAISAHVRPSITDPSGRVTVRGALVGAPDSAPAFAVWSLPSTRLALDPGPGRSLLFSSGLLAETDFELSFSKPALALPGLVLRFVVLDGNEPSGAPLTDAVRLRIADPSDGFDSTAVYSLESADAGHGRVSRAFVPVILLATR